MINDAEKEFSNREVVFEKIRNKWDKRGKTEHLERIFSSDKFSFNYYIYVKIDCEEQDLSLMQDFILKTWKKINILMISSYVYQFFK